VEIRDRAEAEQAARFYAWGRQDGAGEPKDSDAADRFAAAFAAMWQTFRDERAFYKTNPRTAYENWLAHGHTYRADECGGCGRHHKPGNGKPERCARCTEHTAATVTA